MKRIESAGLLAKGQEDASLKGETHQQHAEIHCEVWSCDISAHRWSVLTGFGVHAILKPLVSAIFGIAIVKSGLFYVAVVALSLIVYLFLMVCAMRTWETFKESLRVRFPKAFKH